MKRREEKKRSVLEVYQILPFILINFLDCGIQEKELNLKLQNHFCCYYSSAFHSPRRPYHISLLKVHSTHDRLKTRTSKKEMRSR